MKEKKEKKYLIVYKNPPPSNLVEDDINKFRSSIENLFCIDLSSNDNKNKDFSELKKLYNNKELNEYIAEKFEFSSAQELDNIIYHLSTLNEKEMVLFPHKIIALTKFQKHFLGNDSDKLVYNAFDKYILDLLIKEDADFIIYLIEINNKSGFNIQNDFKRDPYQFQNQLFKIKELFKNKKSSQFFIENIDKNTPDVILSNLKEWGYEEVNNKERLTNITNINKTQKNYLKQHNIKYSKEILTNKRTLVLYCRESEISPLDFALLTRFANQYIKSGKSKVFNDIAVVSRYSGKYYKDTVPADIRYEDVKKDNFKETCSIGANTVHFTHGQPIENNYGSTPILSSVVRSDKFKMRTTTSFIPLYLQLDNRITENPIKGEKLFDSSTEAMAKEFIRSIRELENKMINKDIL